VTWALRATGEAALAATTAARRSRSIRSAPYLHDGGVAVGPDPAQTGIAATLLAGIAPDPPAQASVTCASSGTGTGIVAVPAGTGNGVSGG
jgi:hypothetical protein